MNKVKLLINTLFFLIPSILFSLDLNSTVTIENNTPVTDSTVVLLELDLFEVTDAEGQFSFSDIPEVVYSILVMAPGFQ